MNKNGNYQVKVTGKNENVELTIKTCSTTNLLSIEVYQLFGDRNEIKLDWVQSVRLVKDLRSFISTLERPAGKLNLKNPSDDR